MTPTATDSNSNTSVATSMSIGSYLPKLRFLALVINTADLINERATPSLSIGHALLAPIAIFLLYIFLGTFVIAAIDGKSASFFLQVYADLTCITTQSALSIIVFEDLIEHSINYPHFALVLNGVLPMFTILTLIADLIVVVFSTRQEINPPDIIDSPGPLPLPM